MKIILIIAFTLAICMATQSQMKALKKIDEHHLGNTVLSAISIQLSTGGPMEDIIATLNESKIDLTEEGSAAKSQYSDVQNLCTTCQQSHKDAIVEANKQIADWTKILNDAKTEKSQAESELATAKGNLEQKETELENGINKRSAALAAFNVRVTEHSEAELAIQDAINSFSRIKSVGGASFIQTNKLQAVQDKVTKILNRSVALKGTYAPIIMSLASLASSADPSAIENILALMNKIKTALATSLAEDRTQESKAAADWEVTMAAIKKTIADLNSQIHGLNTEIEKLAALIQESTDIIAAENKTLQEETQLLADEKVWCQEEDEMFATAESDRQDYLTLEKTYSS